MTGQEKSDL